MKIAVVGSRGIKNVDLTEYVNEGDEIVSGGAVGVDRCAAEYAERKGITLTEFLPQYDTYGRAAPIKRNHEIVAYADRVLVFWDGKSRGTLSVIKEARRKGKPLQIVLVERTEESIGKGT